MQREKSRPERKKSRPFQYPRTDRTGCNTRRRFGRWVSKVSFQYPRTDRTGCNYVGAISGGGGPVLSVSSDGSNGMQPASPGLPVAGFRQLSVSSDGSNGMQPKTDQFKNFLIWPFSILGRIERDATLNLVFLATNSTNFQYPRTDRTGCNVLGHDLSPRAPVAFSILGRIERDATNRGDRSGVCW